jgi:ketosteroid isomerase-like protein
VDNSYQAIKNLIYTYADRIDAGDYAGLAQLFEHAVITAEAMDDPVQGSDNVEAMYTASTRLYPDTGTPKTKHVTTNVIIEVDEANDTATAKAYYTVMQAIAGSLALQPVISGRYRDEFERVDGVWRFSRRHMFIDLVGDLSQHLLFEL